MKIAGLWYNPPGSRPAPFMQPVERSLAAFADYGVEFTLHKASTAQECGRVLSGDYDVLLHHEKPFYEPVLNCGRPVVFLERVDGAQLRESRNYLDRIAGVIKSYRFRDPTLYNRTADRYHIEILHRAGLACENPIYRDGTPQPQLTPEQLAKIRTGYGFGAWHNIAYPVDMQLDLDAARSIDVNFVGSASTIYQGTEVEAHRMAALHAAKSWPGRSIAEDGRPWPLRRYYRMIVRSKCVLCPWGWGESTHRDYEAMALGAVVVKPNSDHVEGWPDIYRAGETYVACKPDFSDAHEKIDHIAKHWADYREMRTLARQLILGDWPSRRIAARLITQIKELVRC